MRVLRTLALTTVLSLAVGTPAAGARPGTFEQQVHQDLTRDHNFNAGAIHSAYGLLDLLGPHQRAILDSYQQVDPNMPYPVDPTITSARIVQRRATEEPGRERWVIASPSMGRNIEADVLVGSGGPIIYMFEGVESPQTSGWISRGIAQRTFPPGPGRPTVIIPNQGRGSMWQDWLHDDPRLGRMKWETFYTKELMPLAQQAVWHNGKRGAIGLSMGATGAMMMANNHPGLFDAVAALSGCYSTVDRLGRESAYLTVSSAGGRAENMWGPQGSELWHRNDVLGHPDGLRGTRIHLSAASGEVTDEEIRSLQGKPFSDQVGGSLMETGSLLCTRRLADALSRSGIDHSTHYLPRGIHGWVAFEQQLAPAWEAIEPALR
ncbi:hypothetical protein CPHO_03395 [Corynebacterium phocae]|uniref:Esterase n=1 Tax=Corynebacterium phocae TaxID=161895 RepID=A0A1L7D1S3_9CORY|nr:alpha/beta hydrolase family protein [Corynebacterium phocae]APT92095.1 hypothetical protein CPHO_03395 [Corynebacterium phocae]KAA8726478.1 esterase family protein [Corynebacterium phocae]